MVEVRQRKRSPILNKVHADNSGYVAECSIAIVGIENIALVTAPSTVRTDQLVNYVPSLLIIVGGLDLAGRIGNHLPPKETVEIVSCQSRDHTVGDVEVEKAVVVKIPGVTRARPTSKVDDGGAGSILKALAGIPKQRIAEGVFPVQGSDIWRRILLENLLV